MSKYIAIKIRSSVKSSSQLIHQQSIMGLKTIYAGAMGELSPQVQGTLKRLNKKVVWTTLTDDAYESVRRLLIRKHKLKAKDLFSLNTPKAGLVVRRGYVDPIEFEKFYLRRMLYRR